jgi:hypothetical protein
MKQVLDDSCRTEGKTDISIFDHGFSQRVVQAFNRRWNRPLHPVRPEAGGILAKTEIPRRSGMIFASDGAVEFFGAAKVLD